MRNTLKINVMICYKVRRNLYFHPFPVEWKSTLSEIQK